MKLADATPSQQKAITTTDKTVVVVAGPGSGKTATTVARIVHQIDNCGILPRSIVAITFTNAAARELEHRLTAARPYDDGRSNKPQPPPLGYIGTLHSFALRMLKEYGEAQGYGQRITIISPESATAMLEAKAAQLGCKMKIEDLLRLKADVAQLPSRLSVPQTVIASYYQDLKEAGIVDFDNLLRAFLEMIENDDTAATAIEDRFSQLYVDEVQDSAEIDWDIYDSLNIAQKFYVGDPDQAIYSFRGGRVEILLTKTQNPTITTIALEDNFRSHAEICNAAQRLITNNKDRFQKATISAKGVGGDVIKAHAANEGEESAIVIRQIQHLDAGMSIAILCRTNAIAYSYRQQLRANGLPVAEPKRSTMPKDWPMTRALVELLGKPDNDTLARFFLTAKFTAQGHAPAEIKKMIASIDRQAAVAMQSINKHMLLLPAHMVAAGVLGACITQGVSAESRMLLNEVVQQVGSEATPLELALAMNSVRDIYEKPATDLIQCLTIHGAKGLEFDAVFLVGFEDEQIPGRAKTTDALAEERRLAYVAITRARKFLMITDAGTRTTPWGAIGQNTPSRFIKEAGL